MPQFLAYLGFVFSFFPTQLQAQSEAVTATRDTLIVGIAGSEPFVFLTILAIVGTLLWYAERNKSPNQFPRDPVKGIGNGMWLAIVTMSTTGYGDKAPITLAGRIMAGT